MEPRRLNVPRIALRLAELNLTVESFTTDAGLDRRTVQRLLSGKTQNPQYSTVKAMADFLTLQPRDILLMAGADTATDSSIPRAIPDVEMHWPVTGAYLVGREQEMERLDRVWSDGQTNILSIVAWGGVGKSALVNHWMGRLAQDGWRGAERVFGWTFSSQGMQDPVASADGFIEAALRYCGDPEPSLGTPWDKGQRLARLVGAKRSLLLLDGLEPLQYPPGPEAGKVKDPALATFLQNLALHNAGLCIITTRITVADIAALQSTTADVLSLEALSEAAGAEFLRLLGVDGADAERRAASRECAGHALGLHLLGTYLRDVCGGDVHRRREIPTLDDWSEQGGPAWRIMESYERWFGYGPEVAVLRIMGLFECAASAAEVAALRAEPRIPELNEALIGLHERQWVQALRHIRAAGLLAPPDPHSPHTLDTHPLVRAYYRHKLSQHHLAAWQAGHERLYRHLQEAVLAEYPGTMETLAPLYAAVTHGYLAGRGHEALQVFQHRIRRGEQQFSLEHLGAFGADLAALSSFFDVPWSTVAPGVQADDQLFLFHAVGECLSALGRVFEAEEPLQHALTQAHKQAHWTLAARAALTLSEVYRARGNLTTALGFAEKSVAYVRQPGVPAKVQVLSHTFLGFALYWVGQFEAARATFQTAEQIQQSANPARPLLHSVLGYMYSELLLDQLESQAGHLAPADFEQEWHALHRRIAQALTWAEDDGLPCDIGLQHVSMGRVYAILAWQPHGATPGTGGWTTDNATGEAMSALAIAAAPPVTPQEQALLHCTRAVEYLRRSNHRSYLPRGLLTRAALYRLQNQFDLAHHDLQEALDIARSSAMDFYQADAYLEQAALHLAASRLAPHEDHGHQAAASLEEAKQLMHRMGYYRRHRQVTELEAMLQGAVTHPGARAVTAHHSAT